MGQEKSKTNTFSLYGIGVGTGHTTQEDSEILPWLLHGGKGEKSLVALVPAFQDPSRSSCSFVLGHHTLDQCLFNFR